MTSLWDEKRSVPGKAFERSAGGQNHAGARTNWNVEFPLVASPYFSRPLVASGEVRNSQPLFSSIQHIDTRLYAMYIAYCLRPFSPEKVSVMHHMLARSANVKVIRSCSNARPCLRTTCVCNYVCVCVCLAKDVDVISEIEIRASCVEGRGLSR